MMSASAVKVVDSGGPIEQVIESGGQVFATSRHASGSGVSQIYVANGVKSKTKLLVDLNTPTAPIASIGDLTATQATSGTISGSIELTKAQIDDLAAGRLYIQLHSQKAPDGNLWGWLLPQEKK